MKPTARSVLQVAVTLLTALILGCGDRSSAPPEPVVVKVIAFNDFHGYLVQTDPTNQVTVSDPDAPGRTRELSVGGGAFMATLVKQLRAQNEHHVVVAAGDLIGASPAISSLTADEATIDFMNLLGLEASAVGNHEFDRQKDELKRLQYGGCSVDPKYSAQSCLLGGVFKGASFRYLAANVTDPATGTTLFPSTFIKRFGPVSIGFIGLTLRDTPAATRGAGDLQFADEVATINARAGELRAYGIDAVVVLLHQGGLPNTDFISQQQACADLSGAIRAIVLGLEKVDVVISGHTHREYVCNDTAGTSILLTQASLYGNIVSDIDLTIVPGKGVTAKSARNLPVVNDLNTSVPRGYAILAPDPAAAKLIADYDGKTRAMRDATKGYTSQKLVRVDDSNGARINIAEHPIGYVLADAFLQAAISPAIGSGRTSVGDRSDTIGFINAGGLRNSVNRIGAITFDDLFGVAPFSNNLYVAELTGAQLLRLLEQQWEDKNCGSKTYQGICGRILQPSSNLTYTWDIGQTRGASPGAGTVVTADSVRIDGRPVDVNLTYKVVTVGFLLIDGGDNYTIFKSARNTRNLELFDLDAIFEYFAPTSASAPLAHPERGRFGCSGASSTPGIACSVIPVSCNWPNLPAGATCQ